MIALALLITMSGLVGFVIGVTLAMPTKPPTLTHHPMLDSPTGTVLIEKGEIEVTR